MTPAVALSIAGSDSGGGAGLQADLRTFSAFGVHGTFAMTAITAQNTVTVAGVSVLDPAFVTLQVETVAADLHFTGVKTGMLATTGIVEAVAALAAGGALPNLVVDPVLVSSTGHPLMDDDGLDAYRTLLLPHATVATPNLRETALLTGMALEALRTVEGMAEAAGRLRELGTDYVVVKGGHLGPQGSATDRAAPDVVAGPDGVVVLEAARVATGNDHGTGCSLSAAIAAELALGTEPLEAVRRAKAFVHRALVGAAGWHLGSGHGPIDHLGWMAAGEGAG